MNEHGFVSEWPELEVTTAKAVLEVLLRDMNVPDGRKKDYPWLGRNLGFRNHHDKKFQDALACLRVIMPDGLIVGEDG